MIVKCWQTSRYFGVLCDNIWNLITIDFERIYCLTDWQYFGVSEMYGKKAIMEIYNRQNAELSFSKNLM